MNAVISWCQAQPWVYIPIAYVGMSLFAYIAYALDKNAAKNCEWRMKESTLHLIELLCGWPGAWLAQRRLRHKSVKLSYRIEFFLMVVLNLAGLAYVIYSLAVKHRW